MTGQRTINFSLGGLKCEIVGYEDPMLILDRVVQLFAETTPGGDWIEKNVGLTGAELRLRFDTMALAETAETQEERQDPLMRPGRFAFNRRPVKPRARKPLVISVAPEPEGSPPVAVEPGPEIAPRVLSPTHTYKAPPGFDTEVERMRIVLTAEHDRPFAELPPKANGHAPVQPKPAANGARRAAAEGGEIPPDFLRGVDPNSAAGMMEAAIAWLAMSEGVTTFSAGDAQLALHAIEIAAGVEGKFDMTTRMNAFDELVEDMTFRPVDENTFTLSDSTLFAYEQRFAHEQRVGA